MSTTSRLREPNPTLAVRLRMHLARQRNGCLEWMGYRDEATGYGKIYNGPGGPIGTHVAAWIVEKGPVPIGQQLRHRCDNPPCCDVEHLELGTQSDNNADMVARGRTNNERTEVVNCPAGHPYDTTDHEGYRSCSICKGVQARRSSRKRREARGIKTSPTCPRCEFKRCRCDQLGLKETA